MIYIVMGVSGSGKTTIGQKLSEKLNYLFYDADDFHPIENIEKMRQGIALTDCDRQPWLKRLQDLIESLENKQQNAIIACSCLRKSYRELLNNNDHYIQWIYLKGRFEQILQRLENRENHFMKSNLLQSQFQALEEPKNAIIIDISLSVEEIIKQILLLLNL
ncbi:carbohydrate kinase, thermoresistant glucokinase family [Rippkaea orientalis PCC 8801]|uniref:Gluconokinase n=1 Tax=Rippkaea orientalis (strain PCC 8801 / RF-1) TaxID=41431 RepID=B7K4S7_RIPO1|nr:gluconokinase [Rippkaea orientalis]ACK66583.1 carbohydrate kinase, thermoresistant glucokinase family [Rippkaea orientalis PCC 8801]